MGNTIPVSTDEQLLAVSKDSLTSVVDIKSEEVFKAFTSEPSEGFPNIEGFNATKYYLLDEESGYKHCILEKPEEENRYYYIVRLFTDRKMDQNVRQRLEEEKKASEQFPSLLQKVEFHNATLKFDEKRAALFKVGRDEGNSFMSLFGLNGTGLTYYKRVKLVSSAILNVVKLFELSKGEYCFYPIDISHIAIQENLNVRFFDSLHVIADQNDRESIFKLGLKTICKIGACVLTFNEAFYEKDAFCNEWLSHQNITIPVFSTLFKKVLLENDFTLDSIRKELIILEILTKSQETIDQALINIYIYQDLLNLYGSLLSHHKSDPFHDNLMQYLTQLISITAQEHKSEILKSNENSFLCTLLLNSIFKRDLTNTATNVSDQLLVISNIFKGIYSDKSELTQMISNALNNSKEVISNDSGVSGIIFDTKTFIQLLFSSNGHSISEEEVDVITRSIYYKNH